MSYITGQNQVRNTLITDGLKIKRAVSTCTTLAENGSDDYKNLEVRIMEGGFLISATDGARHLQYSLTNQTNFSDLFCVSAKKFNSVVPADKKPLVFQIRSNDVVIEDGSNNRMQLKTMQNLNLEVIKDIGYSEKFSVRSFIAQLSSLIPLVQGDSQHNYILISKGLMVVQQTLMFGVTETKSLANTYVMDVFTAKLILSLCKQVDDREHNSIYFHKDPSDSFTIVKIGNARLKFATIYSEEINLDEISKMKKVSGYLVNRPQILDALNKIQTLTNAVDVDIKSLTDKVVVSPSVEEFKDTVFNLDAKELRNSADENTHVKATLNIETFRKALKSFRQNAVYIVSSYENVIILFDPNDVAPVRYFISVL